MNMRLQARAKEAMNDGIDGIDGTNDPRLMVSVNYLTLPYLDHLFLESQLRRSNMNDELEMES